MEGRVTLGQLKGKAPEGPHIDLFLIASALGDLRADPGRCAPLRVPIGLLLSQEDAEAEIGKLDIAIWSAEDIV